MDEQGAGQLQLTDERIRAALGSLNDEQARAVHFMFERQTQQRRKLEGVIEAMAAKHALELADAQDATRAALQGSATTTVAQDLEAKLVAETAEKFGQAPPADMVGMLKQLHEFAAQTTARLGKLEQDMGNTQRAVGELQVAVSSIREHMSQGVSPTVTHAPLATAPPLSAPAPLPNPAPGQMPFYNPSAQTFFPQAAPAWNGWRR